MPISSKKTATRKQGTCPHYDPPSFLPWQQTHRAHCFGRRAIVQGRARAGRSSLAERAQVKPTTTNSTSSRQHPKERHISPSSDPQGVWRMLAFWWFHLLPAPFPTHDDDSGIGYNGVQPTGPTGGTGGQDKLATPRCCKTSLFTRNSALPPLPPHQGTTAKKDSATPRGPIATPACPLTASALFSSKSGEAGSALHRDQARITRASREAGTIDRRRRVSRCDPSPGTGRSPPSGAATSPRPAG